MRRKHMAGAVRNFLGTYLSRNCDYRGYWLFGQLVKELDEMNIDLLSAISGEDENSTARAATATAAARQLAIAGFRRQWAHARLDIRRLKEASLRIAKRPPVQSLFGRLAHQVEFTVTVRWNGADPCITEASLLVAPHNPFLEQRRALSLAWFGFCMERRGGK